MDINIFIDTNIFLSFYDVTNEDLNELSKLADSLDKGEIVLYLPEQVRDEFMRNRVVKIAKAMNAFRKIKFSVSFPRMCTSYPEYQKLQSLIRECSDAHSSLVTELERDILDESLRADDIIDRIFDGARRVETTPPLLRRARDRMDLGKPPGKSSSLGDAINWEALLSEAPNSESLYIVSIDGDFSSPLDIDSIDPYLAKEWNESKSSDVYFYRTLSGLFKELKYPILLSEERSKSECVADLENSPNFKSTHLAIAKLSEFKSGFTNQHLNRLLYALQENDQVGGISHDEDVQDFYADLIDGRLNDIYSETLVTLKPWLRWLESILEFNFYGGEVTSGMQRLEPLISLDPSDAMSFNEDIPF